MRHPPTGVSITFTVQPVVEELGSYTTVAPFCCDVLDVHTDTSLICVLLEEEPVNLLYCTASKYVPASLNVTVMTMPVVALVAVFAYRTAFISLLPALISAGFMINAGSTATPGTAISPPPYRITTLTVMFALGLVSAVNVRLFVVCDVHRTPPATHVEMSDGAGETMTVLVVVTPETVTL